jgi:Flp pilus assembly pilin Flp
MRRVIEMLSRHVRFQVKGAAIGHDRGATVIEYGIMGALIAIALILTLSALGGQVDALFNAVSTRLGGVRY